MTSRRTHHTALSIAALVCRKAARQRNGTRDTAIVSVEWLDTVGVTVNTNDPIRIRKRRLAGVGAPSGQLPLGEINLAARATIQYSSEDPAHPIEHLLDGA